jgi:hypothetical protein
MDVNGLAAPTLVGGTSMKPAELEAGRRARELLVFVDGIADAGGCPDLRRRTRVGAQDTLDLLGALEAERSLRVALQDRCEMQQELLGRRAYEAMT